MPDTKDTITVHLNIEITPTALSTIVETAKQTTGRNRKGAYAVDTAKAVGAMVSRFLLEKDFDAYVGDSGNYPPLPSRDFTKDG